MVATTVSASTPKIVMIPVKCDCGRVVALVNADYSCTGTIKVPCKICRVWVEVVT